MKTSHYSIIIITIVFLFHFIFINPLEKAITYSVADIDLIRRPEEQCIDGSSLNCLGMPSGHSECIVIICLLLFKLKLLNLPVSIIIIAVIGLQRILAKRHTVAQVIAGWSIGLLYSMVYLYTWKHYSISHMPIVSLTVTILLSFILISIIDKKVHEPIPKWVPTDLMPIVHKKQNARYYNKMLYSLLPIMKHNFAPFYSWNRLEHLLDKLLEKINTKTSKIDVIVGIKSGGAIIASYIHTKMPNTLLYYIKSKRNNKDPKRDNKDEYIFKEAYDKFILDKPDPHTIVEGINADLSNRNILLLDESVESGLTMLFAKEYLEKEKHVASVTMATIGINMLCPKLYINENDIIYYSKTENATIFPWGYDN